MDHLQRLTKHLSQYLFGVILAGNLLIIGAWWLSTAVLDFKPLWAAGLGLTLLAGLYALVLANVAARYTVEPLRFLWQAILHVSTGHVGTPPPNVDQCRVGRELVTSLSMQVYQLASRVESNAQTTATPADTRAQFILNNLPLPLLVLDEDQNVIASNETTAKYLATSLSDMLGKNVYSILNLSFPNENTFDVWLNAARANKAIDSKSWERVRLKLPDQTAVLQLDMAAFYSKDSPTGVETIITLFDHTERYAQDDQSLGFVALAVHEMRTPLTILRGYIEVLEEELAGKLDDELNGFMHKMEASAEMLAAFVNNILNVARVEENQLTLRLSEENWAEIVQTAGNDLTLRAQIHNKVIQYDIAPGLPPVAVDKVSIYEVINNLVDNALKYSGSSQKIIIKSWLGKDGLINTTVTDFGVGIPANIMPNLFDKFYRNHRTQTQVGGTGLGLYLSKAIVSAQGGQMWVESKEGEGSTFGFSLQPYASLADELKNSDNKDIIRGAHGWIKNHSLYRR